jgi:hypothetical protein
VTQTYKYQKLLNKIFIIYSCALMISGCTTQNEPMPEVVYTPDYKPVITPPVITEPKPTREYSYSSIPKAWLPPPGVEKQWTAIIIHHSATEKGNVAIIDKWHRENNGWDGIGYDFVIGNGTDSGDGQVEVTYRWRQQITGAHCKTPDNWANEDGIGICLVGNFNDSPPTPKQMQSLVKLTDFLQKRYRIPASRIYGHGTTPGGHVTDCPGNMFPMARFKSMLSY